MDNPENRWMHNATPGRMILNPPDRRPSKVIYSPRLAQLQYDEMVHELNIEQEQAKPRSTLEVPWLIKALGTVLCVGVLALGIKKLIGKVIKHK